ncbi:MULTISPECIES: CheR family methyltransferase [unclassified Mameliella]|uniref:CheR family methyltransferase n=1 Tax=unclassified Mameliella TaxID=2630630 RepID=UPI00273F09B2|nr:MULTISPECIES: CheR family methyltransferase [unclassified Mameliella]
MTIAAISAPPDARVALAACVAAIQPGSGLCWLVVPMHRMPADDDLLDDLRAVARVPVDMAEDGVAPAADRVLVVPRGQAARVMAGVLRLVPDGASPLDDCLSSLAACEPAGIAVLLPGRVMLPVLGARALQAAGGVVLAVGSGSLADRVVAAEEAPGVVTAIHRARIAQTEGDGPGKEQLDQASRLLGLADRPGPALMAAPMLRRMAIAGELAPEAYLARLRRDPAERQCLARDVLQGRAQEVSDAVMIDRLRDLVLVQLLQRRQAGFRVWVPGCGQGDLVYQLAMRIIELREERQDRRPWKIFGTDTDAAALQRARSGHYCAEAAAALGPDRRARFLWRGDGGYRVDPGLRELCVFAEHDLYADAPFGWLDLVLCLPPALLAHPEKAAEALARFDYGLQAEGFLAVSPQLVPLLDPEGFEPVGEDGILFRRQRAQTRARAVAPPGHRPGERLTETALAERGVLQMLGTVFASVDDSGRFVHVSTPMRAFLPPVRPGAAYGLQDLRDPDCARAAMEALAEVRDARRKIAVRSLAGKGADVKGEVRVAASAEQAGRYLVVLCKDEDGDLPVPAAAGAAPWKRQLDRLQWRTESAEMALSSANRELMALNEELQSSNMELRFSRGELELINSKLQTFNRDLLESSARLEQQNAELQAIYDGVPVGLGMIGKDMRWSRGNRFLADLFGLDPEALRRAPAEIPVPAQIGDFAARIEAVLDGAAPLEGIEITDGQGRRLVGDIFPVLRDGEVTAAGIAVRDVTLERALEEQKDLLTTELQHRVKNMLAVVRAVTRFTAQRSGDKTELASRLSQRLASMGRTFELLSEGGWDWQGLRGLTESSLAAFVDLSDGRFSYQGKDVALPPEDAQAVGLALHELGTNAVKYGAWSVPDGRVVLDVVTGDAGLVQMTWSETGGPEVVPPERTGFGAFLLGTILERQLQAKVEMDYRPEGLCVTISRMGAG